MVDLGQAIFSLINGPIAQKSAQALSRLNPNLIQSQHLTDPTSPT